MEAPGMAWSEIAKSAYLAYWYFMAGNGVDLPTWDQLTATERHAMEAAARQIQTCMMIGSVSGGVAGDLRETRWRQWTPPACC